MRAVAKSISLPSTFLCSPHYSRLKRFVRTQAQHEYTSREDYDSSEFARPAGLATPRQVASTVIFRFYLLMIPQLAQYLDEYVVGQQEAKKVLSVA